MIDPKNEQLSIRQRCRLLALTRSTIYYKAKPRNEDTALANEIHEIWMRTPFYGYRRITADLKRRGYTVNRKKI